MKNYLWTLSIISIFLLSACSIDKIDETMALGPVDGKNSLVNVITEPAGENCANGGVLLQFGLDMNYDGVLSDDEIQNTAYTCNGIDGEDGISNLVEVTSIEVGNPVCENGGVLVITGIDANGNGIIDNDEFVSSAEICSGLNGISTTFKTEEVAATDETPGGYYLYKYENDVLVETIFISNGNDGKDGVSASILTERADSGVYLYIYSVEGLDTLFVRDGVDGVNGLDGVDGVDGVNGADGQDGISSTIRAEETTGGHNLYITVGDETTTVFVADGDTGPQGIPGKDGVDGINGIDGKDGVSVTLTKEVVAGGTYLYIHSVDGIDTLFIKNGTDGEDGLDGVDGQDGTDGISSNIRTEQFEGGYYLYITVGDDTTKITINDGTDGATGPQGPQGIPGLDGEDGNDGDNFVYNISNKDNNGCYTLTFGYDTNGNGTPDYKETEIELCDGQDGNDGADGSDGTNGVDGKQSFVEINPLSPDADLCEFGGYELITGFDENSNGVFDKSTETVDIAIICNCGCDSDDDDNEKVAICHKMSIGNDWKFVTLYVPQSAVQAHLGHGDELGECN